jgi:hypothetical protein
MQAVNLISDVITTLPLANVDLSMWKLSVFVYIHKLKPPGKSGQKKLRGPDRLPLVDEI